jgi:glucokinase
LTAVDVVRAAESGDPYSISVMESVGEAIGQAIAVLGPAIDPAVVFISGGLGHAAGHLIMPAIERRVRSQHVYPGARPIPDIRLDARGPDAAAIGAALVARRRLERSSDSGA